MRWLMRLLPHLQYFKYVVRHKYYVFVFGRKLAVPLWHLIIHDLSKLSVTEWFPYVDRFYGAGKQARDSQGTGYMHRPGQDAAFDAAWQHHWLSNKHHWQWWTTQNPMVATLRSISVNADEPTVPMADVYLREMVADWCGAGAAQGKPNIGPWWDENNTKMTLHPDTRTEVERLVNEVRRWYEPVLPDEVWDQSPAAKAMWGDRVVKLPGDDDG